MASLLASLLLPKNGKFTFTKKHFPGHFYQKMASLLLPKMFSWPLLVAILNFYVKCKTCLSQKQRKIEAIFDTIFDRRVSAESTGNFSQKIVFPPLLAAVLNFCVKRKSPLISEIERDRANSTKFLTHRVAAESTANFSQKSFSCHFWQPS